MTIYSELRRYAACQVNTDSGKLLISQWENNHAKVTVDPLPQHHYRIEIEHDLHNGVTSKDTECYQQLSDLLRDAALLKRFARNHTVITVWKDDNFVTSFTGQWN